MDNPKHTAFNLNAPQDERTDALTNLQKSYLPTHSDLLPKAAIDEMTAWVNDELSLLKAINPDNVPQPSYAAAHNKDGMQSVFIDDYQASFRGDFWERPGLLSFDQLRSMTAQMPVLNAVVMTRTRQVQRFCRVSEKDNSLPGFEIRHHDRKHQITDAEQKRIPAVASFISNCGSETSSRQRKALRRDSFAQFMGKITRDSLILDSVGIETEWRNDRKLGLNGLYAVDGATIRLCSEEGYRGDPDIYAVQVVNGRIRTAYTFEDLIYEPRNARTDVSCAGYGLPETELLIRLVTGFLNAMALNNNVFDKNSIPKGVLHLFGNYSNEDMAAFRRYWQNMSKGVNNAFAMPILASKDQESAVKFEKFGVDFSEMMFAKWMTFLTSLICAIYGMSPSEINFDSFTGGSTSALGGNDTAEKLAASKDSGLRPLLSYFENLLTDYVVSELDNDFCFRWTGLDVEDQNKKYELRKTLLTLNELRAEEGYEKLDSALGDAPVDASLLNAWMQLQAAQQAEGEDQGAAQETEEDDERADDSDTLQKAHNHDTPHDIFKPHENPFIRGLVEDYYESGMIRISAVRIALNQWLAGQRYTLENNLTIPEHLLYSQNWTEDEAEKVESYLSGINPDEFNVNDLSLLSKLLVRQNLPEDVMIDEAINHAAQSYIMGAAQAAWEAKNPDSTINDVQVSALRAALPTALEGVVAALRLSDVAKATLDYSTARAAENIVALTDEARAKIQGVLMDNQLKRLSGDASATAKKLEQTLFDNFADMNRDWRRIALTETGELSLQGFVASQPIGTKLKRLEQYDGACNFCRKIDGTIMEVVDAESPDKDGKTQIWVGKTNIGRSSSPRKRTDDGLVDREEHELWWLAAGVIHPHCRGIWVNVRSGNVPIREL